MTKHKNSTLYPQWGSGTKPFMKVFKVYTFKKAGRTDISAGDKIILPEKSLKEMKRLRLPFPFAFEIRRGNCSRDWDYQTKTKRKNNEFRQFCSALEFSGKNPNEIFIPVWMMRNIKIKSGKEVTLRSMFNVPKGTNATLQPENMEFFDLIGKLGPQAFLESSMKNYSILSRGEKILVQFDQTKYYINIVQTQPKNVISILGDVDLSIDFITPEMDSKEYLLNQEKESIPQIPNIQQNTIPKISDIDIEKNFEKEQTEICKKEKSNQCNELKVYENEIEEEECGDYVEDFEEEFVEEPKIIIDQEDDLTRKRRMREAALRRMEGLMN